MCTYFIVYTYIANISYISNTKILQEIWMHISNHMAATPPNHICKIHKKQPKKIRFWLPLLLVHWVSNLAALRPPKQLTCTHRSGSSSALDVASIKTRIGYPWWWQIFSHFFWFRTVGLQTKQRAKNMEMVKNESLPFFFLRESHVTCNMFRENICQPVITKWESLYVHAMRKNLQFARWCNLNRPSEAFVPQVIGGRNTQRLPNQRCSPVQKMHDKKSCNSGAKQHNPLSTTAKNKHIRMRLIFSVGVSSPKIRVFFFAFLALRFQIHLTWNFQIPTNWEKHSWI